MPSFSDPHCDELEAMLGLLSPRRELALRLALSGLSEHCRGDARWQRRVAELRRALAAEGVDLADILRDARAARAEILERAG